MDESLEKNLEKNLEKTLEEPLTRDQLRDILRAKVKNCKISRSSATVKQEKLDKVRADLDKILETTGMTTEQFMKVMAKSGVVKP